MESGGDASNVLVDVEPTGNTFWSWLDHVSDAEFDFDLNLAFNKTSPTDVNMFGYEGTDSQPDCTLNWCWYLARQMEGQQLTIPIANYTSLVQMTGVE